MGRLPHILVLIGLLPSNVLAEDARDELIRQIESVSIADLGEGKRQDAKVEDCLYLLRTWGPGVEVPERLWGIAVADLATVTLGDPLFFAEYAAGLEEHGDYENVFREGSDVMHLTQDAEPPGQFGLAGSTDHPIRREEWLGRPRTQSFAAEGITRPSPREDGTTYVFFETEKLAITYLYDGGAAQLRMLEDALTQYQTNYCVAGE